MSPNVNVIVLRTAGTNCNEETAYAFQYFGARVEQVHINDLTSGKQKLKNYHILALPGGFSYGDDIASGKILANELRLSLGQDLCQFIKEGKLVIGICNGFQILAKAGFLPRTPSQGDLKDLKQQVTLTYNDSGRFEDRWIHLRPEGRCVWTQGIDGVIYLPVAHGEGKFVPRDQNLLANLRKSGQIVFRYCTSDGKKPIYPENPNGSMDDVAGICDPTGRVFGLMPHPERHFRVIQHPFWTRLEKIDGLGDGARIFENGIHYIQSHFFKKLKLSTAGVSSSTQDDQ